MTPNPKWLGSAINHQSGLDTPPPPAPNLIMRNYRQVTGNNYVINISHLTLHTACMMVVSEPDRRWTLSRTGTAMVVPTFF